MTCKILEKLQELCQECEHNQPVEETVWIKDPATGLKWGPIAKERMTWQKSMAWAKKQGGRLPTQIELFDLFKNGSEEIKKPMKDKTFWSSVTSCVLRPNDAFYVSFYDGLVLYDYQLYHLYARCVRP